MTKYEYKAAYMYFPTAWQKMQEIGDLGTRQLTELTRLAADGWEVCGFASDNSVWCWTLKRLIKESAD